jgi:hypothetical protein
MNIEGCFKIPTKATAKLFGGFMDGQEIEVDGYWSGGKLFTSFTEIHFTKDEDYITDLRIPLSTDYVYSHTDEQQFLIYKVRNG